MIMQPLKTVTDADINERPQYRLLA